MTYSIRLSLYFLLSLGVLGIGKVGQAQRLMSAAGMNFEVVKAFDDKIEIKLTGPTTGWITVGFNSTRGLVGADLKMMKVVDGRIIYSDQKVVALGNHLQDDQIGGQHHGEILTGIETKEQTQISFIIPRVSGESTDQKLIAGENVWLILAWSHEDDFNHHSARREHVLWIVQ